MKTIPISQITVLEDRQRREFDADYLSDLAISISENGLIHPIVLRQEGDRAILVAGECRLKAMASLHETGVAFSHDNQLVPLDQVPFTFLGELSPLDAMEVELEENVKRRDLSWQELAVATAKLESLRAGKAQAAGLPPPTASDLAREIAGKREVTGGAIDKVREQVIIARHLTDPEVAKAKTLSEARKVVEKKLETQRRTELAEKVGATFSASLHTVRHGDCTQILPQLPSGEFDCILTDPPYGIGADSFGSQSGTGHNYSDSKDHVAQLMVTVAPELSRVARPQAHLYLFCDLEMFPLLRSLFSVLGWNVFRTPLIWDKGQGMLPLPEHGPRRTYEMILYAYRGDKRVLAVKPDVIRVPSIQNGIEHAAQKPVPLYTDLLSRSCLPGEKVLDPFAGSGTIFRAAQAQKVIATGIELSAPNYALCLTSIQIANTLSTPAPL